MTWVKENKAHRQVGASKTCSSLMVQKARVSETDSRPITHM